MERRGIHTEGIHWGVPASRITQFDVGDKIADFQSKLRFQPEECLVRHNALESARVTLTVTFKHMQVEMVIT